jgi:hypothetical protein
MAPLLRRHRFLPELIHVLRLLARVLTSISVWVNYRRPELGQLAEQLFGQVGETSWTTTRAKSVDRHRIRRCRNK